MGSWKQSVECVPFSQSPRDGVGGDWTAASQPGGRDPSPRRRSPAPSLALLSFQRRDAHGLPPLEMSGEAVWRMSEGRLGGWGRGGQ